MSHRWRKSWSYMEVVWNLNESWKMYVTVWVISRPWCWATVKKRRQYLIVLDSQKKWLWFLCSQRNNNVCRIKHNQLSFKTGYNPIISKLAQHTWTHKKRTQLHLHFSVPFFSFCVLISQEQYLVRKKQLWQSSHLASISKWGSAIIVNQRQLTPLQFHHLGTRSRTLLRATGQMCVTREQSSSYWAQGSLFLEKNIKKHSVLSAQVK